MEAKSISQVVSKLNQDPALKQKFLDDPMNYLENIEENPINNKWVFMTIVGIVGLVLLTSIVLAAIIIFDKGNKEREIPEFLISIGSTALGALVGLLSPNPEAR